MGFKSVTGFESVTRYNFLLSGRKAGIGLAVTPQTTGGKLVKGAITKKGILKWSESFYRFNLTF